MAVKELVAAGASTVPVEMGHQQQIRAGETPAAWPNSTATSKPI